MKKHTRTLMVLAGGVLILALLLVGLVAADPGAPILTYYSDIPLVMGGGGYVEHPVPTSTPSPSPTPEDDEVVWDPTIYGPTCHWMYFQWYNNGDTGEGLDAYWEVIPALQKTENVTGGRATGARWISYIEPTGYAFAMWSRYPTYPNMIQGAEPWSWASEIKSLAVFRDDLTTFNPDDPWRHAERYEWPGMNVGFLTGFVPPLIWWDQSEDLTALIICDPE